MAGDLPTSAADGELVRMWCQLCSAGKPVTPCRHLNTGLHTLFLVGPSTGVSMGTCTCAYPEEHALYTRTHMHTHHMHTEFTCSIQSLPENYIRSSSRAAGGSDVDAGVTRARPRAKA